MADTVEVLDGEVARLDAENERLRGALEYAYRTINFGFEYGSFDFSVLRQEAKAYFLNIPGQK